MTAGERLRALAGVSGTAGALLLLIGTGSTAGAALIDYSKLPTGTAAQHLLVDNGTIPPDDDHHHGHAGGGGQHVGHHHHDFIIHKHEPKPYIYPFKRNMEARDKQDLADILAMLQDSGFLS